MRFETESHAIADARTDRRERVDGDFEARDVGGVAEAEAHGHAAIGVAVGAVAHRRLEARPDEGIIPVRAEGDR